MGLRRDKDGAKGGQVAVITTTKNIGNAVATLK